MVRVIENKGENCKEWAEKNKLRWLLRNKLLSLGRDQGTNRPTATFEIHSNFT